MSVKQNDNKIYRNDSCGRLNIMGTIVEDAAPFLYPLVIEYSLIGAAVIFVMWRHIGRPLRLVISKIFIFLKRRLHEVYYFFVLVTCRKKISKLK